MSAGLSRRRSLEPGAWEISVASLPSPSAGRIDPRSWFEDVDRSLELEIGSGKGTFLVQQAKEQPETNFLGIEWAAAYAHHAADRFRRHGLENVRMLLGDAVEFITHWCSNGTVDVIHLYFSDPWPKKRHHKRRVVQDSVIREFHRVLRVDGEIRIVTDHDALWSWYEEHADRCTDLFNRIEHVPPTSAGKEEMVGTNYERKFMVEGRPFHAMTLRKRTV
jgi:tRNA (guanine-N7-)-methyltransferase